MEPSVSNVTPGGPAPAFSPSPTSPQLVPHDPRFAELLKALQKSGEEMRQAVNNLVMYEKHSFGGSFIRTTYSWECTKINNLRCSVYENAQKCYYNAKNVNSQQVDDYHTLLDAEKQAFRDVSARKLLDLWNFNKVVSFVDKKVAAEYYARVFDEVTTMYSTLIGKSYKLSVNRP